MGDSLKVGAVLLAAGAGSRMGQRPKALLELDGVALIRGVLTALAGAGIDDVVVVLGHHADTIEAALRGRCVTRVRNPAPDDGQPSSLRIGLRALPTDLGAVLIALADQPLIEAQDIRALINAFEARGAAAMVVPRVRDPHGAATPGNPVMIDPGLRDAWLAGDVNAAGRRWREQHPHRVGWFDTDNARYILDVDTPDDLQRFAQRTGRVLRWPAHLAAPQNQHPTGETQP